MLAQLFLVALLACEAAASHRVIKRPKHHHHHHHHSDGIQSRALAALAEPSVIPSRHSTSDSTDSGRCNVEVPQSQVEAWQAWLQEGFDACSSTADKQINSTGSSLVMCYRLGFVDQSEKRFGGELLVLQVGTPSDNSTRSLGASRSHKSHASRASRASRASTVESSASLTVIGSTPAESTPAPAAVSTGAPVAAAAIAVASSGVPGIGAIVLASSQVPIPTQTSAGVAADNTPAAAVVAAPATTGSSAGESNGYGYRVRRASASRDFSVELSFAGSKSPLSADMSFVEKLSGRTSTRITQPSFGTTVNGQAAMLIGSFHFTQSFPDGVDGKDVADLAPQAVNVVGQARNVLNVNNALVNLASVSSGEQGFNSTGEWGLFLASTSRSSRLTADNECRVHEVASEASSSVVASSAASSVVATSVAATSAPAISAATSTPAPIASPSSAPVVVAGAAIVLSSAIVPLSSLSISASGSAVALASGAVLADTASASTTPGQQLQVLPVGLGVTAGAVSLGLLIIGFVTWERRKYRKAYRERRLEEQLAQIAGEDATFRGPQDRLNPHVGAPYMSQARI